MHRLLINNKLNTKSASRWFYYTDILRFTINKILSESILAAKNFINMERFESDLLNAGETTRTAARQGIWCLA
jgi:hypothetical protein